MRRSLMIAVILGLAASVSHAQTVDELIGKYVKTIGGMEKLQAIKSIRYSGKLDGGGGFTAVVVQENRRPNFVREEFALQGMAQIIAYDGKVGWIINPFQGKKDAETMGEEGMKGIIEDSDFDGPLIDYAKKGNKIEFLGKEDYEGSDTYKLKVTLANGTVKTFFLDSDYFVPIKIETKQTTRGTEVEFETILGDYKEAGGIYFPYSIATGPKGGSFHQTITYDKIEINPTLDDSRFNMPKAPMKAN